MDMTSRTKNAYGFEGDEGVKEEPGEVSLMSILRLPDNQHRYDEKKRHMDLNGLELSVVPFLIMQQFKYLCVLDLSFNCINTIPSSDMVENMPYLTSLFLQNNGLRSLENILELSTMAQLRELNIANNPLPLNNHRIYFLEKFLTAKKPSSNVVLSLLDYYTKLRKEVCSYNSTASKLIAIVPRNSGFPVLQVLNDRWITQLEMDDLQKEMGRAIQLLQIEQLRPSTTENGHNKRSTMLKFRKTHMEKERMKLKTKTIPDPPAIRRFMYEVEDMDTEDRQRSRVDQHASDFYREEELSDVEWNRLQKSLNLGTETKRQETIRSLKSLDTHDDAADDDVNHFAYESGMEVPSSTWTQNQNLVHPSKWSSKSPFSSDIILDSVEQVNISRSLADESLKKFYTQQNHRNSIGNKMDMKSMVQHLAHEYGSEAIEKKYRFHRKGCERAFQAGDQKVQIEFRTLIEEEHFQTQMANKNLIARSQSTLSDLRLRKSSSATKNRCLPSSDETLYNDITTSLTRLRLKNAIKYAPIIPSIQNEKHFAMALLNSERKVFEEEVIRQRQTEHQERLRLIENIGKKPMDQTKAKKKKTQSSWQKRNSVAWQTSVSAKEKTLTKTSPSPQAPALAATLKSPTPSSSTLATWASDVSQPLKERVWGYETIESVEAAQLDPLPHVASQELMLRCADIRSNYQESLTALEQSKHDFVRNELAWEEERSNKLAVLTKKINREAEMMKTKELLKQH